MSIANIPEVINDFNIYNSGNKLVGVTGEVSLPELEALTETISGAGILGEIDASVVGRYGSIEQEIPFRVINRDFFSLINPTDPVSLTLRGSVQELSKTTGAVVHSGMRYVIRGTCKKIALGTVKQGGPMDSSITQELTYILIEIGGKKVFELDKLNGVFKVNGRDLLAPIKKYT